MVVTAFVAGETVGVGVGSGEGSGPCVVSGALDADNAIGKLDATLKTIDTDDVKRGSFTDEGGAAFGA